MKNIKNIIILASGNGSNTVNIIRYFSKSGSKINVSAVISNIPDAPVINKVRNIGNQVAVFTVPFTKNTEIITFEEKITEIVESYGIDYIILAGFMKVLSKEFVSRYEWRIINIHPSLLPAFKGKDAIKDAFNYGVKFTGVTIHFVTGEVDSGPVIMQGVLMISEEDNLSTLESKVHALEHRMYPLVLELLADDRIAIKNGKVKIHGENKKKFITALDLDQFSSSINL